MELRDLVYICASAYSNSEIVSMETRILKTLGYRVTIGSTHCFLVRYLKAAHADRQMVWLACFIAERTLQEYTLLKHCPSMVASSAVYLARKNLRRSPWSTTLIKYTGYKENELQDCSAEIISVLNFSSNLVSAKRKYSSSKFGGVSGLQLI